PSFSNDLVMINPSNPGKEMLEFNCTHLLFVVVYWSKQSLTKLGDCVFSYAPKSYQKIIGIPTYILEPIFFNVYI
ncbi:hypothetical protein, partial [Salinibacillus aidingensis]|uniref:hypothetical protein n=1 Tax=Salinibacillus aidingensis TaxID=237684 RepID=UPI0031E3095E